MNRNLWHRLLCCPFVCLLVLLLQPPARSQSQSGPYAQADVKYGAQLYKIQCTPCHGQNGDVVSGTNFRSGQFRRVTSDIDLRSIITTGIPGTAMPAFSFNPAEITGIIAFVRNMGTFDAGAVAVGDPARGLALFAGMGNCGSCHRVNGRGPRFAPDLSNVGTLRTPDFLERTLLEPNASMLPANRTVRTVTRDGHAITGRRLNEDTYTIQLIDEQEHLISLTKSDLRGYQVIKTSSMPSYKNKFSSEQVADMVAYLLSLKGLH